MGFGLNLKATGVAAVLAAGGLMVGETQAATYTYEFTAADILNNVFVNGADGSSAADNGLFDGARLLRNGTNANSGARTFVESQHDAFNQRWSDMVSEGYTLNSFNLWGLDGNGINWGEDFKPFEWVSVTAPTGWTTGYHTWPWSNPPADANTLDFPWFAHEEGIALDLTQEELEAIRFTVTIAFEDGDEFWGADTNGAPNDLSSVLTMWFGANLYDAQGNYGHMYEGNLQANVVPLPAAAWAGLTLLGGIGSRRWMKRRKA